MARFLRSLVLTCAVASATAKSHRFLLEEDDHHDHDHADHPQCSCEAAEPDHPFTIDCDNGAAIRAAADHLATCTKTEEACQVATDGVKLCQQAFFIVQAHHDYCPHDTLHTSEELLMHDYETYCWSCDIGRAYDATHPQCDAITCTDTAPAQAALDVLVAGCPPSGECCKTEDQQKAFITILSYHDLCGADIPEWIEDGLHDYEHDCEDYWCNTETGPFDPMVCVEEEAAAPTAAAPTEAAVVNSAPGSDADSGAVGTYPVLALALLAAIQMLY